MLALSTSYYIFYNNYNTTLLLYKVCPEAYLRVRSIKNFIGILLLFLLSSLLLRLGNHVIV